MILHSTRDSVADRAFAACAIYAEHMEQVSDLYHPPLLSDLMANLIRDLGHLSRQRGIDFDGVVSWAVAMNNEDKEAEHGH